MFHPCLSAGWPWNHAVPGWLKVAPTTSVAVGGCVLVCFTANLHPPSHSCCFVPLCCCLSRSSHMIKQWSEPDSEAWIQQKSSQFLNTSALLFTQRCVFSDISKACFHPAHKAPHVEHISQPPCNNPFLDVHSLPQRPPVKEWNHGTEDAIISVKKRQKSACRRMVEPSVEVCLLVNKAFFPGAAISSDPSFGELPLNQLVPVWSPKLVPQRRGIHSYGQL